VPGPRGVLGVCQELPGDAMGVYQRCARGVSGVCQVCARGCARGVSGECQGPGVYQELPGVARGCHGCVPEVCQGCARGVSGVCQELPGVQWCVPGGRGAWDGRRHYDLCQKVIFQQERTDSRNQHGKAVSCKAEHFCQFQDPCKNCPFGTFFWPVERLC
jgi:hypothetical protein